MLRQPKTGYAKDPDNKKSAAMLVNAGVSFVNTDFPRTFDWFG
jgi:hypothetical protein